MAPRAYWKGYLKLSLVSCAVSLYPATSSSERTSFHTLNAKTGNRVKRQYIDGETGEVVPPEDQVRGYEVSKGEYVVIEDDELEAVRLESTHTIDIDSFVARSEVDERYLDKPYYLAPEDRIAQEAFAVIREAMRVNGLVGLARVVLQRRERLVMLEPLDKGLLGTTLHYAYEMRDAAPYFEGIEDGELPKEMLDLAAHIMRTKAGKFDPSRFQDRYEEALVALVREKQQGRPTVVSKPERPTNVINLLDALRRSIAAEGGRGRAAAEATGADKGDRVKSGPQKPRASAGTGKRKAAGSEPAAKPRRKLKKTG
jgi:DNA end-binding protein Ku